MLTYMGIFSYFLKQNIKTEFECFRSTEWFPTASKALNWSLNETPAKVESYSQFILWEYNITVTRHEIIVQPSEEYTFGYDVILIFYGDKTND